MLNRSFIRWMKITKRKLGTTQTPTPYKFQGTNIIKKAGIFRNNLQKIYFNHAGFIGLL